MSGRAVAFLATFLLPLVLVRAFDPPAFGTYKLLFLVYLTVYNIGQLGMAESLFYFLPRAGLLGGRYVANSMLWLAGTGLVGLALLVAGAPALARWLGNPELARHLPLMGLFLSLMMPAAALEVVMIARRRHAWAAWSYGLSDVVRAVVLVAPALVFRRLDWLLLGACAFATLRLGAALLYFRRELGHTFRPLGALQGEQLAYALPFAATVLLETVQASYHQYAVAHRFDAATFALYTVGCFQVPLLELVASPLANLMMVQMAEKRRDGRPEEALAVWRRTTRALALVFFPVVALLQVAASDLIVFLFTDSYRDSVPIFRIWSLALALSVLQTHSVLRVYAATRFMFLVGALKLLLIAGLIGTALTAFGLPGAVLVTLGVGLATTALMLGRMKTLLGVGLGRLVPWRDLAGIGAAAASAGLVALVAGTFVEGPALFRLAVTGLVGAGAYLVVILVSGLLEADEKLAFRAWLQRFAPRALSAGESGS